MKIVLGDCLEVLRGMEDESIDAVVTDPPYGLGSEPTVEQMIAYLQGDEVRLNDKDFMGKDWAIPTVALWRECLRVLKPGGYLLAFAGTRTQDLIGMGIRAAGFESRDTLMWIYGQGFPKSANIAKQIDRSLGVAPTVVGKNPNHRAVSGVNYEGVYAGGNTGNVNLTRPTSPEAQEWEGWGTALKPAYEPIVMARKPFKGAAYRNVMRHRTGALNIDATRIPTAEKLTRKLGKTTESDSGWKSVKRSEVAGKDGGRWPAHIMFDEESASLLDEQSGHLTSGERKAATPNGTIGYHGGGSQGANGTHYKSDSGGASRFFYVSKASKKEKNAGLDGGKNTHPTVKPVDLMRWLVRMVTPPGGTVLDPFCGSGTTGVACVHENLDFVGIELEREYAEIADQRLQHVMHEIMDDLEVKLDAALMDAVEFLAELK